MRRTGSIELSYVIGFICEGTKSEPYYLQALNEWCRDVLDYDVDYDIHPAIEKEDESADSDIKSGRKVKARKANRTQKEAKKDPLIAKHEHKPMPCNWIAAGEELLDAYSEVWVLFDKDGHPKVADAFNDFRQVKANTSKSFNLIFSSRCFEHYMLVHHELNDNAFDECECHHKEKKKNVPERCCTPAASQNACSGDKCINGYARLNQYWTESKNDETFVYMPNLWRGILWAWHVTSKSICKSPITQPFEDVHNPFLNIYSLTARLMGYNVIEAFTEYRMDKGAGGYVCMSRDGNDIVVDNRSQLPFRCTIDVDICALPANVLHKFEDSMDPALRIDSRIISNVAVDIDLQPSGVQRIELGPQLNTRDMFAIFTWDDMKMFFAPILDDWSSVNNGNYDNFRLTQVTKDMILSGIR